MSSLLGHGITRCSDCDKVIRQCRCINHTNVRFEVCKDCRSVDRDDLFPYKEKTPQVKGRENEAPTAKVYNMRPHPNSGAGKIKGDASNADEVGEFKMANKSHTLGADELAKHFRESAKEGKDALYVVEFANGIVLEGYVYRR